MTNRQHSLKQRWLRWAWITPHYMRRMPLVPRNRFFNLYLHHYSGPDRRDEGLHDHPWNSLSIRLWGGPLYEWRHGHWKGLPDRAVIEKHKLPRVVHRPAERTHAIADSPWPAWTLFITGPWFRKWGFWTRAGWRPAEKVIAERYRLVNNAYEHRGDE